MEISRYIYATLAIIMSINAMHIANPCKNPTRNYQIEIQKMTRFPLQNKYDIVVWSVENKGCPWIRYGSNSMPCSTISFDEKNETMLLKHTLNEFNAKLFYLFAVKYGSLLTSFTQEMDDAHPQFCDEGTLLEYEQGKKKCSFNIQEKLLRLESASWRLDKNT